MATKIYMLTKNGIVLKMAKTPDEILAYRNKFPLEEKKKMILEIIIPPHPVCWRDEAWRWN